MRAKLGLVLVVMACFAFNSVATRYLVAGGHLDAATVTIARFAAGATMLALLLVGQGRVRDALPRVGDIGLVLFLAAYALAIAYGYLLITAAAGTFVFYALVIATMTLAGPRPGARALAGAALALGGVAILAVGRVEGSTPLGVALLALTGATWGAYSLLLRRAGTPLATRPDPGASWSSLASLAAVATNARAFVGVALLLPLLALVERDRLVWSWPGLALGAFMGAVTTALAYALWARVLPSLSPIQAGTFQLLVPVLTAVAGVAVLGEPFSARLALAGAMVLAGMALSSGSTARPAR